MSTTIFPNDVQIEYTAPSYQYKGTEPGHVYHEDTEITGAMYRAKNATFSWPSGQWTQVDPTVASYCVQQDVDGSIHFLYMPPNSSMWLNGDWQSDDVQEYYAANYGINEADSGAGNTAALIAAAGAVLGNGGGILRLPAGTFSLDGPVIIDFLDNPYGLIIAGFSSGTKLIQTDTSADIFTFQNASGGWGVVVKDMNLSYASGTPGTVGSMAAVNLTSCENVRCERVYFEDCPMSFQSDGNCLQCGLFECTIAYDLKTGGEAPAPVDGQTMVTLQGSMDFITGCVIRQQPQPKSGPSGCTGIALAGNANGRFVTDTHSSEFQTCMTISDNANSVYCVDSLFIAYGNALVIQPTEDTSTIYDLHFTGCTFAASLKYAGGTSGVIVSTNGGPSANVAGIYFANCSAYGFGNSGIEIDSGQNIVITGGQYSSNGQSPAESYNAAGIVILGGNDITITGVDCSGENGFWTSKGGAVQPYGISIGGFVADVLIVGCNLTDSSENGLYLFELGSGGVPANVYVRDCDASGYSAWSVALNITGNARTVQVTNCAGYNDQSPAFITSPASGPPSGAFYNYTYGYFGPVSFYVGTTTTPGVVLIGAHSTLLSTGAFYLPPGVSGQVTSGPTKPNFQVIGQ